MRDVKNIVLIAALAVLFFLHEGTVMSQTIIVDRNVPFNPTVTFPGPAGADVTNQYTNTMGDYDVNVRGGGYGQSWHVDISKTIPGGDPTFTLEVQRNPNDARVINGPLTYTAIPDGPGTLKLFSPNNRRSVRNPGLNIQYRLTASAATANIRQGTFIITVTFTLSAGL